MSRGMRYGNVTTRLAGSRPDDWREQARCRDVDPETFHPTSKPGTVSYQLQVEQAKATCRRCPVVNECLQFAVASRDAHAIAGGMTPEERSAYLRAVNR